MRSQVRRAASPAKYFAFVSAYSFHFSGRSSSANIAETGQTGTHAPQSMHSDRIDIKHFLLRVLGSSFLGWMQSTGQASTQAESLCQCRVPLSRTPSVSP